jgi:hypothetical protein
MTRRGAIALPLALLFGTILSGRASAGPSMTSTGSGGTSTVSRDVGDMGGGYSSSGNGAGNNALFGSAGQEVAITTTASGTGAANSKLRAGWSEILSYPGTVNDLSLAALFTTSGTFQWSTPPYDGSLGTLQSGSTYFIRIASYTAPDTFNLFQAQIAISTSGTAPGGAVGANAPGLQPNTTWYGQLWTVDADADASTTSNRASGVTLALPPYPVASPFLEVDVTSVTVSWGALGLSPSSSTSEGYVVEASSTNFGALFVGGVVSSSMTTDVRVTTLTVLSPSLVSDKLYYFRVGSRNWLGQINYVAIGSTQTAFDVQQPLIDTPTYTDVSTGSIVVHWQRNGAPTLTLFHLDSTLTAGFGGAVASTTTFNLFGSTTTLSPNTTYYFRVFATSKSSVSPYTDFGSTMTYAWTPAAAASAFSGVQPHQLTTSWLNGGNPVNTSTYSLVASTEASFPNLDSGNVFLTTRPAGASPTGTLTGSLPNTTYYLFAAALNSVGAASPYQALGSTLTPAAAPLTAVTTFTALTTTGFTAIWNADGNPLSVTTYTVEASTSPTFDPGATYDLAFDTVPNAPAATFTGLNPNTTYYFRVRARDFDGRVTAYSALGSTSTFAATPQAPNFDVSPPTSSSLRLDFASGGNGPGTWYRANISTASNFGGGAVVTTQTVSTLFISTTGLSIDTTYFMRVAAIGNDGTLTAFVSNSTPTLANAPLTAVSTFSSVQQSSFTAFWSRNGNLVSVTTYTVQVSTAQDFNNGVFDQVVFDTAPAGGAPQATFTGLTHNTTYYFRVSAQNYAGVDSAYAVLGATSTRADAPAAPSVAEVSLSSLTISWTPVSAAAGYELKASSTNFGALLPGGSIAFSSAAGSGASALAAKGLVANTTYYFRLSAYDWGLNTTIVEVSSHSTLAATLARAAVYAVNATAATANWTPAPGAPQSAKAEGYVLEASTAASIVLPSDFTGTIFSSATYGLQPATLTVSGLDPGTTYTLRVGALNWSGDPNYATAGSTVTRVSNFVWSNGAGGAWNTGTNWTPNGIPSGGSHVTIDMNVTVTAAGTAINFFSLDLGDAAGSFAPTLLMSTTVAVGRGMTVYNNATFTQGIVSTLTFSGDVTFLQGATLNHSANGTSPQTAQVDLSVAGTFTLSAGATAAVSGLGFNGGIAGGGAGVISGGGGGGGGSTSSGGGGGGHGGVGGAAGGIPGGTSNDSLMNPVLSGSGGGGGQNALGGAGGKGGGVVIVNADTIQLDGLIATDGAIGGTGPGGNVNRTAGGGGAGGSVNLSASNFGGVGTISAQGGAGGTDTDAAKNPGGGGAGGRVSLSVGVSGSVCDIFVSTAGAASGGGTSSAGNGGTLSSTSAYQAPAGFAGGSPTAGAILWTWSLSNNGKGYQVFDQSDAPISSVLGPTITQFSETGLLSNTTYTRYVRVTGCGNGTNSLTASRSTLASAPLALATSILDVQSDQITAAWAALPTSPQGSAGYVLEASSTNFGALSPGGVTSSSSTLDVRVSTLTAQFPPLQSNTTYFFRVAAYNWIGELSAYTTLGSISTLAPPPSRLASDYFAVYPDSAAIQWAALPASPLSSSAEGYVLEASTTDFGARTPGGLVLSSATSSIAVTTLTLSGINLATTYYLRVGSLNHNSTPNYTTLTPLNIQISPDVFVLHFGTIDPNVVRSSVSVVPYVITNLGNIPVTYTLSAVPVTPGTPWVLGSAPGVDVAVLQGLFNTVAPPGSNFATTISASTAPAGGAGSSYAGDETAVTVAPGQSRTLWIRLTIPNSSSAALSQALTVTVDAIYP